jgi:hypothetical protein
MMKKVFDLVLQDFKNSPVWTWAEDVDEAFVIPIGLQNSIDDLDALFIYSVFDLYDNSQLEGFIAIRVPDLSVYSIGISNNDGLLMDYSLVPSLQLIKKEDIAAHIGKTTEAVFPLRYRAKSVFSTDINGMVS